LFSLSEWQRNPETPKKTIELTDPETKEKYTCEIFDYHGIFPVDKIPDSIARLSSDIPKMTGKFMGELLKKKHKKFREATKVIFLELAQTL
jgi:hypothetical protein